MSIYITGDVHGDFSELQQWCCAMESKKSDIIVILGSSSKYPYKNGRKNAALKTLT